MYRRLPNRATQGRCALLFLLASCTSTTHPPSTPPAHPAPPLAAALPECQVDAAYAETLHFERSPAGRPEAHAEWLRKQHCNVHVIDVRNASELSGNLGRLPFAEHIPLNQLVQAAAQWAPNAPIVLVCRSGQRSATGVKTLEDLGFTNAASMAGGMMLWNQLYPELVSRTSATSPPPEPPKPSSSSPITQDSLRSHLENRRHISWVKVASLLTHGTESCVDGRGTRPILGTPGGDAGELLLGLATLEQLQGAPIAETDIPRLLDAYLDAFGRFYIHTDAHALHDLATHLKQQPAFAAHLPDPTDSHAIEAFVRRPPRRLEKPLLTQLVAPAHVGCGHLKLALTYPDQYGVRPELTRALLRSVYQRLWQGHPIDFVVLRGNHRETAVVDVRLENEVHAFSRVPMITPRIGNHELFVNHSQVTEWLRKENTSFLFQESPWLKAHPELRADFIRTQTTLGKTQLNATLQHLASTLPVYQARFGTHSMEVKAVRSSTPSDLATASHTDTAATTSEGLTQQAHNTPHSLRP